jgi:undecaprenyl diphosphate synthase
MEYKDILAQLDPTRLPQHVAIITDGNGRWAKKHHVSRLQGHQQGARSLRDIVAAAVEAGLSHLTIYAFSTENWRRSKLEVNGLMKLIMESLIMNLPLMHENNVKVDFIGSRERVSEHYMARINELCSETSHYSGLRFHIAMNYGSRLEIVEGVNRLITEMKAGARPLEPISEKLLGDYLYTVGIPDPDLIIRTSGEQRLSNFLLWQAAYAEFIFTKTLWPDFSREEFVQSLVDFQHRDRRFGVETK